MRLNPKKLRRPYGNGGYKMFKATLAQANYARLKQLVPTGAGQFGSALINFSIEVFYMLIEGSGVADAVKKFCRVFDGDPDALHTLAQNAMKFAIALKVASDKAAGNLVVMIEKERE